MFNRQPFNRGKFNVSTALGHRASGIALMELNTNPVPSTKIISATGSSRLAMKSGGDSTIIKYSQGNVSNMAIGGQADGTKVFIVAGDVLSMTLSTKAEQLLSGEQVIDLYGIVLKPGDELVINNCDMTVTINGQNAMKYFSNDSEFISLLNGTNTIDYSDSNSKREIAFDVIWKDRWL